MPNDRAGQVRPRRKTHPNQVIYRLARSRMLENLVRSGVIFIMITGLLLITVGLLEGVNSFTSDLSSLVRFAGGGDAVLTSTADLFQVEVLKILGLASPEPPVSEDAPLPDPGTPTLTPFMPVIKGQVVKDETQQAEEAQGFGFIPFQVEIGGKAEQAPALDAPPKPAENPQAAPLPTGTASPPAAPGWIVIPRINLDAPVIVSNTRLVEVDGKTFEQWEAPNEFAAGWQEGSALLGEPGNTVLNGHHNIDGEVFGHLFELSQGDEIIVYSGDRAFHYRVSQVMKLKERDMPLEQRQENVRWVMPSADERLTLVTCWPPISNTYRLIVVAVPVK